MGKQWVMARCGEPVTVAVSQIDKVQFAGLPGGESLYMMPQTTHLLDEFRCESI
jgi:hypothetical protein